MLVLRRRQEAGRHRATNNKYVANFTGIAMGKFSRELNRRRKEASKAADAERLAAAAIIRNGETHSGGFKEHWRIRALLGDENPTTSNLYDTEGFMTSAGRFVTRDEAREVALECGQIDRQWRDASRKLLSSDINW